MLRLHRPTVLLFSIITFLDRARRNNERFFSFMVSVPCAVVAWYLPQYVQFTDKVQFLGLTVIESFQKGHPVWWVLSAGAVGFVFERMVGGLAFPALSYLPWAIATRALGLEAVTRNPEVSIAWTNMAVRRACKSKARVRVICLSGKHMWWVTPVGLHGVESAPLETAREKGLIDALMPISNEANPTVSQRFKTYSDDFKNLTSLQTCADLVSEMEDSKRTLLRSPGNTLLEHKILCMWRVILTDEYCVVQNYFPNLAGAYSFNAPTFLFRRREPRDKTPKLDTYYAVFENMYRLMAENSKAREVVQAEVVTDASG